MVKDASLINWTWEFDSLTPYCSILIRKESMTNRQPYLGLHTLLIGLLFLSFGYNIHLYTKLQALENNTHFTRCGTSEYEFRKLQDEIKRLENNPFLHIGEQKSVLKK